eukprot:9532933-Ditylum_brightwellii.AAC.1
MSRSTGWAEGGGVLVMVKSIPFTPSSVVTATSSGLILGCWEERHVGSLRTSDVSEERAVHGTRRCS